MKAARYIIIIALTVFCLVLVCAPLDIVPDWVGESIHDDLMSSVKNFPFLEAFQKVILKIIGAINKQTPNVSFEDVFELDGKFVDQSFAMIIVSLISVVVANLIGRSLYAPVYPQSDGSVIVRFGLYSSNNLVSIMTSWLIYQFLFEELFRGFVLNLPGNLDAVKGWIYYGAQAILSLGLFWGVLSFIAVGVATEVALRRVIMPIFGSVLKTICFDAAIAALIVATKDCSKLAVCLILFFVLVFLSAVIGKYSEYYKRSY